MFLARRDDLLELDARRNVYEAIRTTPGLHLRELARETQMDVNHVKYHAGYLAKHDLVVQQEDGHFVRFYATEEGPIGPMDKVPPDAKAVLAFLRRPVPIHIMLLLLDRKGASHGELLQELDVAHGTLHYHLQRLEEHGVLVSKTSGRRREYRLKDAGLVLRLMVENKPPDRLVKGFLQAWEELEL